MFAEYRKLQDEIAQSGKHHEGFRRLKKTMFHLEKVARQNGTIPRVERHTSAPRTDLFVRKPAQEVARVAETAPAAPDLFNKYTPPVVSLDTEIRNAKPPDLFKRKGNIVDPTKPIPDKKSATPKDPKRKVMADSEQKGD